MIGGQVFEPIQHTSERFDITKKNSDSLVSKIVPDNVENFFTTLGNIPQAIYDFFSNIFDFFKNFDQHVWNFSINTMDWIYETVSMLVLQTPLWLFDNEWFSNTTMSFSLISVGLVALFTIINLIKKMIWSKRQSDDKKKESIYLWKIAKRFFLAAGISSLAPFLFQTAFKWLNWLSQHIINLGGSGVVGVTGMSMGLLNGLLLLLFDIILIVLMIPLILQNGRRFFDLVALGVLTPFAMSSWVFDSTRHYFRQWWSNVKRLSLHQIVYAFFLFLIGLFIFGADAPKTFEGMIFKLITVLGGFYSMINVPNFIRNMMDKGGGIGDFFKAKNRVKDSYRKSKRVIRKPISFFKDYHNSTKPQIVKPMSRMSRLHGRR